MPVTNMDRGVGHIGQMGDGGHQGLRQGDLPHIEDEAEDKGDVDVAQQGADQIDRLGVGAAVSAHHPHTQV